jgi:hypothetical protein
MESTMLRYYPQRQGDKWVIFDRSTGDAIGFVHSDAVAGQVVDELNKMERARA